MGASEGTVWGGDRSLVGSAGPPQGHASSLTADLAMVMDLPYQATPWPCLVPSTLEMDMVMDLPCQAEPWPCLVPSMLEMAVVMDLPS